MVLKDIRFAKGFVKMKISSGSDFISDLYKDWRKRKSVVVLISFQICTKVGANENQWWF